MERRFAFKRKFPQTGQRHLRTRPADNKDGTDQSVRCEMKVQKVFLCVTTTAAQFHLSRGFIPARHDVSKNLSVVPKTPWRAAFFTLLKQVKD